MTNRDIAAFFAFGVLPLDVYSLNVPVPGNVARLATELAREMPRADPRAHRAHSLVAKRLGIDDTPPAVEEARAREVLADQPAFALRISGIDWFEVSTSGTSPVVYLDVESPGLHQLHQHLCDFFDPVDRVEGDDYTPHVTIARDGDPDTARQLLDREIEPIEWVVDELAFYDAEHSTELGRVSLG